jgi:hypothetical protein
MLARTKTTGLVATKNVRLGIAALELAACLPLMFLLLSGLWEGGRITELCSSC